MSLVRFHAAFVRSDHAHGTLRGIEIDAAMRMPGVVGILTGDDLLRAGVGCIHRIPLARVPDVEGHGNHLAAMPLLEPRDAIKLSSVPE